jgi:NhaA family Na+:H+ antiporter
VVFLTALAIVDDLGAIIVIAVFYTDQLSWGALLMAVITFSALVLANKLKVRYISVFIAGGIILWVSLLNSGIHATIAGVLLGMVLPVGNSIDEFKTSLLYKLEHALTPWSSFLVMPIFALANSGIVIDSDSLTSLILTPVSLGIIAGLFIGKQLGIFGISCLLIKLNIAKLPSKVTKKHLYGASVLAGMVYHVIVCFISVIFR